MPLLDGRYEVLGQRELSGGRTLIDAIAPDGTPVRVEWFDLPAVEEAAFERYRRLLKRLKREDRAAIHDVISRPGARYVAWQKPDPALVRAEDPSLTTVLLEHGYPPTAADVRGRGGKRMLYGLGFDGSVAPPATFEEPETLPARPLRSGNKESPLTKVPAATLSWLIAGALLLVAVVVAYGAFKKHVVDGAVTVPDVLGSDVRTAIDRLAELGLGVQVSAVPSEASPGSVVSVDPDVGVELRPGRSVRLGYALAQGLLEQAQVPALIGLAYPDEVSAELQAAGLVLGDVGRVGASAPPGVVLAQSIAEGGTVGAGGAVDVLVSLGPPEATTFLPDLIGMSVDGARELAVIAGIDPGRIVVDEVSSGTGFPGEVLTQSPSAHRPIPVADTTLRLVVSAGTPRSDVGGTPDVVGLSRSEAAELADAEGWSVDVQRISDRALPAGMVVAQSPPPLTASEDRSLLLLVNVHPVTLLNPGVRAILRSPEPRDFEYAWTILPGIGRTQAQVWVRTLDGERTLVATHSVEGGEILRGSYRTSDPGPLTFELFLGDVPYGDPLLVP